jgi:hypothetical protein
MDRLRAMPGGRVGRPRRRTSSERRHGGARFRAEGTRREADGGTRLRVTFSAGDYFKTMGIDVIAGHPFETDDHLSPLRHVVISKSRPGCLWPGQERGRQAVPAPGTGRL